STFEKHTVYERNYDSLGNVLSEVGTPDTIIYNDDTLSVNDTFKFKFIAGLLPDWDIKLSFSDIHNGHSDDIITIYNQNELVNEFFGKSILAYSLCKEIGTHKLMSNMTIKDKKYNKELNSKDSVIFIVKNKP